MIEILHYVNRTGKGRRVRVTNRPGYRVYYAMIGREAVLLLCGGDKRTQVADIERAAGYLKDYKERSQP